MYEFTCDCGGQNPDCMHEEMMDNLSDAIFRYYSSSEENACENAKILCEQKGFELVF